MGRSPPTGGDLGGTGGRSPPKVVVGTAHASAPQYLEKQCYRMRGKVRTD